MQNNSIQTQNNNQEWLTTKEAAAFWGVTVQAMSRLIKTHSKLLGEEVQGGGKQKRARFISKEGLIILRNIANVKSINNTVVQSAKQQLAKKATSVAQQLSEATSFGFG